MNDDVGLKVASNQGEKAEWSRGLGLFVNNYCRSVGLGLNPGGRLLFFLK